MISFDSERPSTVTALVGRRDARRIGRKRARNGLGRARVASAIASGALALGGCGQGAALPTGSGGQSGGGSGGVSTTSGGSTSSGGVALSGSGGASTGSGGIPGSGGGATLPGQLTDLSGKTLVSCGLSISNSTISPDVATVGVVEFGAELAGATSAFIQFGQTADYELEAPVDLAAPSHRTLLLGMVAGTEYHYRIALLAGDQACVSQDQSITTGPLPSDDELGPVAITAGTSSAAVEPGFVVSVTYDSTWIYVLDDAGNVVWYFSAPFAQPTCARMSWDGQHIWVRDGNPMASEGAGQIAKISMDGSSSLVMDVPTSHHDVAVLPDGSIAYIMRNPNGTCDAIYKHAGDAASAAADTLFFDVADAFPGGTCHVNSIHYHDGDGSFTFSDLNHDAYVKVSSAAEVEWVLGGGESSDFSGDGASWERQHGHHLLANDLLLFFNNGPPNSASPVREVSLDLAASTASFGFEYESTACGEPCASQFMGDVQRLPHGNTFVTYSSMGIAHEIDPAGALIRALDLPAGQAGYSEHRPTLYGPPPR